MQKKRILVAPLNWGLGHATRCIPIIKELLQQDLIPVLASDGAALRLLQKEFPDLENYSLPGYNIRYAEKGEFLSLKLLFQAPHIFRTIRAEMRATEKIVAEKGIHGIISDNRWGVRSQYVPSVFVTHQINVLSGVTTYLSSKIQQWYIKKFDECWVPDSAGDKNLSGKMGHLQAPNFPVRYLGVLSRFNKKKLPISIPILVLLSGPEPQRSLLESVLENELKKGNSEVVLVRGIVEPEQKTVKTGNITFYNFMTSAEIEFFLNSAALVICRSGYSGVMDLIKLEKPALLIPTPGQPEQIYLAKRLKELGAFEYCNQEDFKVSFIHNFEKQQPLIDSGFFTGFQDAFALFKRE